MRPYFAAYESLRAAETRVPAPRKPEPRNPAPRKPEPWNPAPQKPTPGGLGFRSGPASNPNPGETETEEVRRAFEQARVRAAAIVRRQREDPGGDLLGDPAPRFGVVGPVVGPVVSSVVGPPEPGPAPSGEWDELTSRIRVLLQQRQGATA